MADVAIPPRTAEPGALEGADAARLPIEAADRPTRGPRRRVLRGGWWRPVAPFVVWLGVLALLVLVGVRDLDRDRDALRDRLAVQTASAAGAIAVDMDTRQEAVRDMAGLTLTGASVTPEQLGLVARGLGFSAGALFDAEGLLLQNFPQVPELLGRDFTAQLEHVRIAEGGRVAVSQVFISPALQEPVVGIAVPFDAPAGRRIVTSIVVLQGERFDRVVLEGSGLAGGATSLVDRDRNLIAATFPLPGEITSLRSVEPELADALAAGPSGRVERGGHPHVFTSSPVGDTGWTLIASVEPSALYEPVAGSVAATRRWTVIAAVAGLALAVGFASTDHRRRRAREALQRHRVLQAHTAELEDAMRQLETFSYSVSHDLRAPLRAIQGFAQMLEEDHAAQLDAEGRRLLGVVAANASQMGQLIDDILAFSRAGQREITRTRIDMDALVSSVLASLQQEAPDRSITVVVDDLPTARGDRELIRLVWANLLGNAFKFTSGRPHATVRVDAVASPHAVTYRVHDDGVGFDMTYANKLFGAFQRLHGSEFPGNGIGLAIVHRIVSRHGGTVVAQGEPGVGATFSFTLPTGIDGEDAG